MVGVNSKHQERDAVEDVRKTLPSPLMGRILSNARIATQPEYPSVAVHIRLYSPRVRSPQL
ncbi:MAG: hypothetical protein LBQ30_02740 [Treponema sp.]|nr:hypothetical protein [Treponema sp.]